MTSYPSGTVDWGSVFAWTALAVAYTTLTLWYWSGRAPAWIKQSRLGAGLCMFGPGGILLFVSEAINSWSESLITEAAAIAGGVLLLVGMVAGIVQSFTTAQWWGPRWYREESKALRRAERDAARGAASSEDVRRFAGAILVSEDLASRTGTRISDENGEDARVVRQIGFVLRRPERWSREIARDVFGDSPIARWRAWYVEEPDVLHEIRGRLIVDEIPGWLELHHGGVVFFAGRFQDWFRGRAVVASSTAQLIRGVWLVPPGADADGLVVEGARHSRYRRLVIEDDDGICLYALRRAERRIDEVASILGCEVRERTPRHER